MLDSREYLSAAAVIPAKISMGKTVKNRTLRSNESAFLKLAAPHANPAKDAVSTSKNTVRLEKADFSSIIEFAHTALINGGNHGAKTDSVPNSAKTIAADTATAPASTAKRISQSVL